MTDETATEWSNARKARLRAALSEFVIWELRRVRGNRLDSIGRTNQWSVRG